MRHIELLGIPGSGKSTLSRQLAGSETSTGRVWALEEAARRALRGRGSHIGTRAAARLTPNADNRLWKIVYSRAPERAEAMVEFASHWSEFLESVVTAQRERVKRDHGQSLVLSWILNLGARFVLASRGIPRSDSLIIDEGFAQRALAVFGHGWADSDRPHLARYLQTMPKPEVIVRIDAEVEICRQRLDRSGWPQRASQLSRDERVAYLERARETVDTVATHLDRAGVQLVEVAGDVTTRSQADFVRGAVSALN